MALTPLGGTGSFASQEVLTASGLNATITAAVQAALLQAGGGPGVSGAHGVGYRTRSIGARLDDVFNVCDYGADPTGTADATAAFQNALNAIAAAPNGGVLDIPAGTYLISAALMITLDATQTLALRGAASHSTKILGSAAFEGVLLTVTLNANSTEAVTAGVQVDNLDFVSSTSSIAGTALYFTQTGNAPMPALRMSRVTFSNEGSGCWAFGYVCYAMNVTYVDHVTFQVFLAGAVGCHYDTDTRISVEHHLDNFFYNGAGIAIDLGSTTTTGNLQGFSVLNPSVTGTTIGIRARAQAGSGGESNFDMLFVHGGQFNCSDTTGGRYVGSVAIFTSNVATVHVSKSYFLYNSASIYLKGGRRHIVAENVVIVGSDTISGDPNQFVVVDGTSSATDAGCMIQGNMVTDNPNAGSVTGYPVQVINGSDNVQCINNFMMQGTRFMNVNSGTANQEMSFTTSGIYYYGPQLNLMSELVAPSLPTTAPSAGSNLLYVDTNGFVKRA